MNPIVYDVEVLRGPDEVEGGWENPEAMGFGTAVAYHYKQHRYYFFQLHQKQELIDLLASGDRIITFNGFRFDDRVLLGNDYGKPNSELLWSPFDILLKVVQSKFNVATVKEAEEKFGNEAVHDGSIGLDGLAEGTLGLRKTGHGAKAPILIKEEKWADVFAYNLNDVRLTRKLYDFIQKYGYVIDRTGTKIIIEL